MLGPQHLPSSPRLPPRLLGTAGPPGRWRSRSSRGGCAAPSPSLWVDQPQVASRRNPGGTRRRPQRSWSHVFHVSARASRDHTKHTRGPRTLMSASASGAQTATSRPRLPALPGVPVAHLLPSHPRGRAYSRHLTEVGLCQN